MTWFWETWRSDWRWWEAVCSSAGREGHGQPGSRAVVGSDVAGGLVAQSCHPPHGPRGAGLGSAAAPFPFSFPVEGWSNLGCREREWMLSSACARPGSIRDADTVMTVVHFWFSTLYSLLLIVLPAVEREGGRNSLPHHPFLYWAAWGRLALQWHGAGQGSQGMGQAGILVTWGRLGPPWTGQAESWSTRREGQAEQNTV